MNESTPFFIDNNFSLIHLQVNDKSLEGLGHRESIRALVESGTRVRMKLIRFLPGSPQAECLTMLQRQVTILPYTEYLMKLLNSDPFFV